MVRSLLERAHAKGVTYTNFHDQTVFGPVRDYPAVNGFFKPKR